MCMLPSAVAPHTVVMERLGVYVAICCDPSHGGDGETAMGVYAAICCDPSHGGDGETGCVCCHLLWPLTRW